MPLTSKKISRLEKEAILRAKDYEYKREQSANLFTDTHQDDEEFENDRHRRHDMMRQARQIQREIDHQVGLIDKLNERKQQEIKRKQNPPPPTTRSYMTSLSSTTSSLSTSASAGLPSTGFDRTSRSTGITEKYTNTKHTSGSKLH